MGPAGQLSVANPVISGVNMTFCNTAVGKRNGGLNPFLSDMWRDRVEHVQLGDTLDVSPDLSYWKDGENATTENVVRCFPRRTPSSTASCADIPTAARVETKAGSQREAKSSGVRVSGVCAVL